MGDALTRVARDNARHPVREYLEGLPPCEDPAATLEDFAVKGIGAKTPLDCLLIRKFLVAAVRRILNPGVKHDGVLVLFGPQGTGKSSLLYALSPQGRWVQESLPDLENKDACEALRGRWLVEIAELQALIRKSEEVAKDFLSRQEDSYRRPYDRGTSRYPRQCVFIATTNTKEMLRDVTGARRYWTIETSGIDVPWVEMNRDLIWSAALHLATTEPAASHHLTSDERTQLDDSQEGFKQRDPWHEQVEGFLAGKQKVGNLEEVWLRALHGSGPAFGEGMRADAIRAFDKKSRDRLASVMRACGWETKTFREEPGGPKRRGWTRVAKAHVPGTREDA